MILYVAGSQVPKMYLEMADRAAAKNILLTFAHEETRKCARYFTVQKRSDLRLLIDSGAYTAWTQGIAIDLVEYIEFARELRAAGFRNLEFIALDVIAGRSANRRAGKLPSRNEIDDACRRGFDNYLSMQKVGIPCLPTFHRDDPWNWLDRIAESAERFCLAALVGTPLSVKLRWLAECFRRLGPSAWKKHRVHALGISSQEIMETFPFYSVDNTDAVYAANRGVQYRYLDGYGRLQNIPKGKIGEQWGWRVWDSQLAYDSMGDPSAIEAIYHYRQQGESSESGKFGSYWFTEQAMRAGVQLESYVTEHWKYRGVIWDGNETGKGQALEVEASALADHG